MKILAKILGAVGVVLLVAAPLTWYLLRAAPYAGTYALIKVALGVAFVAMWVWRGRDEGDERAFFFYVTSAVLAVLVVGFAAGLNFAANRSLKPQDWTTKKIFSLAPQTTTALEMLKEPVHAIGFLDVKERSQQYDAYEYLFKRFADASPKFTFEFKDPKVNPDLAAKYELKAGQSTAVIIKGTGAGAHHTTCNIPIEQELTNALLRLNAGGMQKVYVLGGHGEWPLEKGAQNLTGDGQQQSLSELKTSLLQEGYAVEELNLFEQNNAVPRDATVLVIAKASTRLTDGEQQAIATYLDEGGHLVYFAEFETTSGLEPLLQKYGVQVEPGVVADGMSPREPFVVSTSGYGEHEITSLLKRSKAQVVLPTVRALTPLRTGTLSGVTVVPLVASSPMSWNETKPDEAAAPSDGERTGALPLVVAVTRDTAAAPNKRFDQARIVVFGDSELIVDANWGVESNRNLVLNSIGWGTSQIEKITIRPPDRDLSTLDLSDDLFSRIVFVSIDVFPTLLIALGIAIYVQRKSR